MKILDLNNLSRCWLIFMLQVSLVIWLSFSLSLQESLKKMLTLSGPKLRDRIWKLTRKITVEIDGIFFLKFEKYTRSIPLILYKAGL